MTGEIEEPLRFNFQADLLHSGSISFGRFESESLSWENKSSFSHNRYLEEVKKYSKPGSVTEKKAYFEAHFKRKALLKQSSSESQDGREFPTSENDDLHDSQESDNGNDSKHSTFFDESPHSSGRFKYDNNEIEIHRYDVVQNVTEDTNANSVDPTNEIRTANVDLIKSEEITEVTLDASVKTVGVASEIKQTKAKPKAHANEASIVSAKTKIREIKGLTKKEPEKKSPRPASSLAHSLRKTSKAMQSSTSFPKTQLPPQNKSAVKDHKSDKSLPGAHQSTNRTKQTILTPPGKPHAKQTAAGFNFKSDERAERRKEEKRAAAEAMRSNTSNNFKATPMPSFYKEPARSLNQNNVLSTGKTPNRPRTASTAPTIKKVPSNSGNSSNPRPSSSTSLTSRNRLPEPSRRVQEKKKELGLQKQKQHEAIVAPRVRATKGVGAAT